MNPITPPTSSPAKRKRSYVELDSPVTPTRPRLQIPSPQQDVLGGAMSPRTQVAGRFRNLSIQKAGQGPASVQRPSHLETSMHSQPLAEEPGNPFVTSPETAISPQDSHANTILQQLSKSQNQLLTASTMLQRLSDSQKQLLAASSPTPTMIHPPTPPPAQIAPSTLPATPPLQPLTATLSQPCIPPSLNLPAPGPLVPATPSLAKRAKSPSPGNKAAKTTSSPSPTSKRARSPPPPPTSVDPDEDDMTGVNGIGYRPTPAQAYARAQKRRQQLKEWKVREDREMRGRRAERRRGGLTQDEDKGVVGTLGKGGAGEAEGERKVRFVGVVG